MGAPYPKGEKRPRAPPPRTTRSHWAFQPPKEPAVPQVKDPKDAARVQNPIDAFVLSKLEEKGLDPQPPGRQADADPPGHARPDRPAARRRRRWTRSSQDDSPDAFAKVVDRLLASPRYGERWGRHWLDVARYSDTKGYVFEEERRYPYAYTYRDWVIAPSTRTCPTTSS